MIGGDFPMLFDKLGMWKMSNYLKNLISIGNTVSRGVECDVRYRECAIAIGTCRNDNGRYGMAAYTRLHCQYCQ